MFAYGFMQNAFIAGTVVAILAAVWSATLSCSAAWLRDRGALARRLRGRNGRGRHRPGCLPRTAGVHQLAGVLMGVLGRQMRGRDVAIGGTLAFSLALGSLFLTLSTKFAGEAVNILFGNILAISPADLRLVTCFACRRLAAHGRDLPAAAVRLGRRRNRRRAGSAGARAERRRSWCCWLPVSTSVQVVGVLLIFALLILPAAAAQHLTARPPRASRCRRDRRGVRLGGPDRWLLPAVPAELFHHRAELRRVRGGEP